MSRLIIHTGSPKTGSTSLQLFLFHNRETLGKTGLLLAPTFGRKNHNELCGVLLGGMTSPKAGKIHDRFWDFLAQHRGKDILVSAELLSAQLHGTKSDEMPAFIARAASTGHDVEFVTFLRHFPGSVESGYSQRLKKLNARMSFEDAVAAQCRDRDYLKRQVGRFRTYGRPAVCIPFNAKTRSKGIERSFLEAIGYWSEGLVPGTPLNERVGICRIAACATLIESTLKSHKLNKAKAGALARIVARQSRKRITDDPAYRPLTPELASALEDAYRSEADAFATETWGRSWFEVFAEDVGCPRPTCTIRVNDDPEKYQAAARDIVEAARPLVERELRAETAAHWRDGKIVRPRRNFTSAEVIS